MAYNNSNNTRKTNKISITTGEKVRNEHGLRAVRYTRGLNATTYEAAINSSNNETKEHRQRPSFKKIMSLGSYEMTLTSYCLSFLPPSGYHGLSGPNSAKVITPTTCLRVSFLPGRRATTSPQDHLVAGGGGTTERRESQEGRWNTSFCRSLPGRARRAR